MESRRELRKAKQKIANIKNTKKAFYVSVSAIALGVAGFTNGSQAKADTATNADKVALNDAVTKTQAGYEVGSKGYTPTASAAKDPNFAAGVAQGQKDYAAENAVTNENTPNKSTEASDAAEAAANKATATKAALNDAVAKTQAGYEVGSKGYTPTASAAENANFAAGVDQGQKDYAAENAVTNENTPNKSTEASDAAEAADTAANKVALNDAVAKTQAGYEVGSKGYTPTASAAENANFAAGVDQGQKDYAAKNAFTNENTPNKSTEASDAAEAADTAANKIALNNAITQTQAGYEVGSKNFTPTDLALTDANFAAGVDQGQKDYAAKNAFTNENTPNKSTEASDAAEAADTAANKIALNNVITQTQAGYEIGSKNFTPTASALENPNFAAGVAQGQKDYAAKHAAANKIALTNAITQTQAGYEVGSKNFTPTDLALTDANFAAGYAQGQKDYVAKNAFTNENTPNKSTEASDAAKAAATAANKIALNDIIAKTQAGYEVGSKGFTATATALKNANFAAGYAQGQKDYAAKNAFTNENTPNKSTEASDAAKAAAQTVAVSTKTAAAVTVVKATETQPTAVSTKAAKNTAKATTAKTAKVVVETTKAATLPKTSDTTNTAAAGFGIVATILGTLGIMTKKKYQN